MGRCEERWALLSEPPGRPRSRLDTSSCLQARPCPDPRAYVCVSGHKKMGWGSPQMDQPQQEAGSGEEKSDACQDPEVEGGEELEAAWGTLRSVWPGPAPAQNKKENLDSPVSLEGRPVSLSPNHPPSSHRCRPWQSTPNKPPDSAQGR